MAHLVSRARATATATHATIPGSSQAFSAAGPTLSRSSCVSSVSGSWENMQSSALMQFPVVWNSLQGKSRSGR